MKVELLAASAALRSVCIPDPAREITQGFTSDLLSDVMANAEEGSVLITIQGHKNSVAVASLIGLPAIILCSGRNAPEDMIAAAREQQIALLGTDCNQFETSCIVADLLGHFQDES